MLCKESFVFKSFLERNFCCICLNVLYPRSKGYCFKMWMSPWGNPMQILYYSHNNNYIINANVKIKTIIKKLKVFDLEY